MVRLVSARPGAVDQAASADNPRPVASSAAQVQPLGVGQKAPQAAMQTPDGQTVSMDTIYRREPTVLVFYRGGWRPYCNTQLSDLAKIESELRRMGFQIIAVSMDNAIDGDGEPFQKGPEDADIAMLAAIAQANAGCSGRRH